MLALYETPSGREELRPMPDDLQKLPEEVRNRLFRRFAEMHAAAEEEKIFHRQKQQDRDRGELSPARHSIAQSSAAFSSPCPQTTVVRQSAYDTEKVAARDAALLQHARIMFAQPAPPLPPPLRGSRSYITVPGLPVICRAPQAQENNPQTRAGMQGAQGGEQGQEKEVKNQAAAAAAAAAKGAGEVWKG